MYINEHIWVKGPTSSRTRSTWAIGIPSLKSHIKVKLCHKLWTSYQYLACKTYRYLSFQNAIRYVSSSIITTRFLTKCFCFRSLQYLGILASWIWLYLGYFYFFNILDHFNLLDCFVDLSLDPRPMNPTFQLEISTLALMICTSFTPFCAKTWGLPIYDKLMQGVLR